MEGDDAEKHDTTAEEASNSAAEKSSPVPSSPKKQQQKQKDGAAAAAAADSTANPSRPESPRKVKAKAALSVSVDTGRTSLSVPGKHDEETSTPTKSLSPPKQRWVTAINWAMSTSTDNMSTEDLLLELSVLKADLGSLKGEKAIAEFQETAGSLVERCGALVRRVSREQARLEEMSEQVGRTPTSVIGSPSANMRPLQLPAAEEDDSSALGLDLKRQISRTRSASGAGTAAMAQTGDGDLPGRLS